MYEPNFSEYSLRQLQESLNQLNRTKYPDRLLQLQREISLRQEAGEVFSDPVVNELLATDVPWSLAIRACWGFLWRLLLLGLLVFLAAQGLSWLNGQLPQALRLAITIGGNLLILILAASAMVFSMMQVLAKRYTGFRIRIVRVEGNNSPTHNRRTR